MKILITGASGQLGQALKEELQEKHELILTVSKQATRKEKDKNIKYRQMNLLSKAEIKQVISEERPEIIINGAAFTAVDLCEEKEEEAYFINGLAVQTLVEEAAFCKASFLQVSTDYVFSGKNTQPYLPDEKAEPLSIYGKTKLAGEQFALQYDKTFVVRTAWLYGEGNNFVKTILRLSKEKEEIRVVDDQYGSPTSAAVLARILSALIQTKAYGIYHGVCKGAASRYEFAKEVLSYTDSKMKLIPVSTEEYPLPAKRPLYAVLDYTNLLKLGINTPSWQEALKEYLKK